MLCYIFLESRPHFVLKPWIWSTQGNSILPWCWAIPVSSFWFLNGLKKSLLCSGQQFTTMQYPKQIDHWAAFQQLTSGQLNHQLALVCLSSGFSPYFPFSTPGKSFSTVQLWRLFDPEFLGEGLITPLFGCKAWHFVLPRAVSLCCQSNAVSLQPSCLFAYCAIWWLDEYKQGYFF